MLSPFGEPFDSYFEQILKPGLGKGGHELLRADESYAPGMIVHSIFRSILDCDVVIADLTRKNPNVFYELGVAHAYGKKVVLIVQSTKDLPFDVRHLRCIKYDPESSGWGEMLVRQLCAALSEAPDSRDRDIAILSESVFSGKQLRRFTDVIQAATQIIDRAENYFFVTRTSPNESILPHETDYFAATQRRLLGSAERRALPNYRRLVYLNSRDSLSLAQSLLEKYYQIPGFQMAAFGRHLFPVNFEVYIADDEWTLLAFGAEQSGGPIESGLVIRNPIVAGKWKSFFLNLWEHPDTVPVKLSGVLVDEDLTTAKNLLNTIFQQTKIGRPPVQA